MKLEQIYNIGLGGCGSKLVNTFADINSVCDFAFMNSNSNEMKHLSNYSPDVSLNIKGDGTGRDRLMAKESLKEDKNKFAEFLYSKIGVYDVFNLFFSMDGGFGSGAFPIVSKLLRNLNNKQGLQDTKINLCGVAPRYKSRKKNLQNTLSAYRDILDLREKGIINSFQIINNNRMQYESKFNKAVITEISNSFMINNIELDKLLDNIKEIVGYLNAKLGTRYLPANEKTQRLITARFNENKKYTVADFKEVIDKKVKEWKGTEMEKYLRPETLFGTKFESYLNQKEATGRNSKIGEYMQRSYSKDDYEKMFEKATDFSGEDIE